MSHAQEWEPSFMHRNGQPSRDDGMDDYFGQIQGNPLLSAADERHLAQRIANGDKDARNQMVRANLRLVVKIARDYVGRGLSLADLVGEGNLGLIRAAEEFDPRFGTRFSTYASYWIKERIRSALTNTTATIRLPAHMVRLLSKWRKAERALYCERDQMPDFDEVATRLNLTPSQRELVKQAIRASQIQGERQQGSDDDAGWSSDETSGICESPDVALERDDDRRQLSHRLNQLDDRERVIVALRYGLAGEDPLTCREVGERLSLSYEWIRKVESRAVRRLAGSEPKVFHKGRSVDVTRSPDH